MILSILLACYGDVGIIKREEETKDTSVIVTTEPASSNEPTFEPSWEPAGEPSFEQNERNGISGYTYLRLRQVACPACMGNHKRSP